MNEILDDNLKFQYRATLWARQCFPPDCITDTKERASRFVEEALELVQSCGLTLEDVVGQADHTFHRSKETDVGSEVGGVMVTLAVLCHNQKLDLQKESERELAKCLENSNAIRLKHLLKHGDKYVAVDKKEIYKAIELITRIKTAPPGSTTIYSDSVELGDLLKGLQS